MCGEEDWEKNSEFTAGIRTYDCPYTSCSNHWANGNLSGKQWSISGLSSSMAENTRKLWESV